jgi:dolichol-phosphate mannosyltransferase
VKNILVLIPTYNESESVILLLQRIDKIRRENIDILKIDILVIDDNSPDKTGQLAQSLNLSGLTVLSLNSKNGIGPAYIAGFKFGLTKNYDFFIQMDADLSHQPEEMIDLVESSDTQIMVIGSRWIKGGSVVNWPKRRRLISRFGTAYAARLLGLKYRDLTSGYRVLPKQLVADIDFVTIKSHGYGFQIEMALQAIKLGYKIKEVPITFIERENGKSKMSFAIVIEAWKMVSLEGFKRRIIRR